MTGFSALTYAALHENYRSIKILIENGADSSIIDVNGRSILDIVATKLGIKKSEYTILTGGSLRDNLMGPLGSTLVSLFKGITAFDNKLRLVSINTSIKKVIKKFMPWWPFLVKLSSMKKILMLPVF